MDFAQYPIPHPQVAVRVVDGKAIIVLAGSGEVKILNEVGTRIWELIEVKKSLQEIVDTIQAEYEVTTEQAQADVESFVQSLIDASVLTLGIPER